MADWNHCSREARRFIDRCADEKLLPVLAKFVTRLLLEKLTCPTRGGKGYGGFNHPSGTSRRFC